MKHSQVFFLRGGYASGGEDRKRCSQLTGICRQALVFGLLAVAACVLLAPSAFGQIQSTISCPSGHGYWDVLSVMMMDPGLASGYHMEGITNGLPSSYVYTIWDESQTKVYYVKNPQGNPWDINLYDSNYIYQWVTELDDWNGVNHWNDPTSCKKFNNGSQNSTSDLSMRWAARCAVPGGANSAFWNPPPPAQSNNTNYYTYVEQVHAKSRPESRLFLAESATHRDHDHYRPPRRSTTSRFPLQLCPCNIRTAAVSRGTSTRASFARFLITVWIRTSIRWTTSSIAMDGSTGATTSTRRGEIRRLSRGKWVLSNTSDQQTMLMPGVVVGRLTGFDKCF